MNVQEDTHEQVSVGRDPRSLLDGTREQIGAAIGTLCAPAVSAITKWRHARMFHPLGYTFAGYVEPVAGPYESLGRDLTGRVLARCSAALWRDGWEHFDVLGLALRFRRGPGADLDEQAAPGDQDLLTATIRSPLTMLASPLFTDASDFVANKYWAVSPFAHNVGRIELRLVPIDPPARQPGTREQRLRTAVEQGNASWWLEARRTLTTQWHPAACVSLDHEVRIDQARLAFDPFRGNRLRPVGLVHAIRRAVYAAGQQSRPRTTA
ncbi:MAG TPA: hypothetical protein VIV40_26115 [Kofleriaceae bacterium]|jgi:hypothetical protein